MHPRIFRCRYSAVRVPRSSGVPVVGEGPMVRIRFPPALSQLRTRFLRSRLDNEAVPVAWHFVEESQQRVNLSAVQMRDHAPMGIFSLISTRRSGRSRCAASGSCPSPISIFADVTKVCEVAHMRLVPARLYSTPFIRRSEMHEITSKARKPWARAVAPS